MNGSKPPAARPAPMPRWFWLLPAIALVAWWPIAPYWASDDFVALHYATDFHNVLRDFIGPQYGAQDIWLFYRPLIVFSFWHDLLIGGTDPWFAHFSNVLAHAVNALLVGLIWRRFVPARAAFAAGALWCLQPAHAGAILWAIGRVDSHTTVWCLLSAWSLLRHLEGSGRARWFSLATFALALASKELAIAVPALLIAVVMLRSAGTLRARFAAAMRTCAPHLVLLLAYFIFRRIVLGVFVGGYAAAAFDPVAMVAGLGRILLNLVDPLLWTAGSPGTDLLAGAPAFLAWAGLLPGALALAVLLRRRQFRSLLAGALLFLIASAPSAPFWMEPGNVHNLRYFYLPCAALAGLCSLGGRSTILLALLVQVPALIAIRADYVVADRQSAAMHHSLLADPPGPVQHECFVAGLPHTNARGTVMQLHFGVDRLKTAPWRALLRGAFWDKPTQRTFALRPFTILPTIYTLDDAGQLFALPEGSTVQFAPSRDLVPVAVHDLPDLPLVVRIGSDREHMRIVTDGVIDLRSDGLQRLKDAGLADAPPPLPSMLFVHIDTPGISPQAYRVTFFTATGYLCSVIVNHALPLAADGQIDLRRYFLEACCTRYGPTYVLRALEVPSIHDLDTDFPLLIEAGSVQEGPFREAVGPPKKPFADGRLVYGDFVATHRARVMLRFRCDRQWPARIRAILGQ